MVSEARTALDEVADVYLDQLRVERGLSRHTLQAYGRDLAEFIAFAEGHNVSGPRSITVETLSDWLCALDKNRISSRSAARKLSSVRGFLRFLLREGEVDADPSALVKRPRFGRRLPKPLTIEQMVQLIRAPDPKTLRGLRDRALLSLAYAAGLRVSELLGLRLGDVDFQRGVAQAFGKGKKRRLVPLGEASLLHLGEYLERRRREAPLVESDAREALLFPSPRGGALSRQSFWKIVVKCAVRAGLGEHVHPHRLRHSFATHLLSGGADLRSVQTLLGHSDIATTEVYTLVTRESLRGIHASSHPRG